jgi:hypothetical protein
MPRLPALESREWQALVAPGCIYERGHKGDKGKTVLRCFHQIQITSEGIKTSQRRGVAAGWSRSHRTAGMAFLGGTPASRNLGAITCGILDKEQPWSISLLIRAVKRGYAGSISLKGKQVLGNW